MAADYAVKHQIHDDQLDEMVPLHHRSKVGRRGLLTAIAGTFQQLENIVYDVYIARALPNATGVVLDFWGWLAGVSRTGLEDIWYRPLINTAFLAKRSTGTVNELVEMWRSALVNPIAVEFTRYKKNCVILTGWRTEWLPEEYAKRAGEVVVRGCPLGSVVLLESQIPYVGGSERDYYPLPSPNPSVATGAKVWWPVG